LTGSEIVAARLSRDLQERRVWLDPALGPLLAPTLVGTPGAEAVGSEVVVVAARALSEDGLALTAPSTARAVLAALSPPLLRPASTPSPAALGRASAPEVFAVLLLAPNPAGSSASEDRKPIVGRLLASDPTVRVGRVYCELAVLEVATAGLIVLELARGVSATDLQALAEPTLKITPRLAEMVVDGPAERRP
jgi:hypothetical protein